MRVSAGVAVLRENSRAEGLVKGEAVSRDMIQVLSYEKSVNPMLMNILMKVKLTADE